MPASVARGIEHAERAAPTTASNSIAGSLIRAVLGGVGWCWRVSEGVKWRCWRVLSGAGPGSWITQFLPVPLHVLAHHVGRCIPGIDQGRVELDWAFVERVCITEDRQNLR